MRRRRVRLILLLLVLAGAGGGYWLAHRDPSPLLRTIALPATPRWTLLDEPDGRVYIYNNDAAQPVSILDNRTGTLVRMRGALGHITGLPWVDRQDGHYFDTGSLPGKLLMIDMRTDAVLKTIPLPSQGDSTFGAFDERRDRALVTYADSPNITVIDGRSGRILREVPGCPAYAWPVLSQSTQRLFEPCGDGRLLVFDSASYHQVASILSQAMGPCSLCAILADEATGRMFVPADNGFGVLDARTGAVIHTLPIGRWSIGARAILPGSHDVVTVPYVDPSLHHPARSGLVLDGHSGAILHRWPVPENPVAVQVNPLTGHLLVASAGPVADGGTPEGSGSLSVLDARTGRALRRIDLGVLPGALAADGHTRHLFVVNFNATMHGLPLFQTSPEGWWPQFLRRSKGWAGWLPFKAPDQPMPHTNATVVMLDLTKL
jgi:DNA-binding beta-propeller fold protein YncE